MIGIAAVGRRIHHPTANTIYLQDTTLDTELSPNTWTHTRKTNPGGELDCLAIDDQGRLLTIEVKPADEMGTGAWAPAQAMIYAQLFRLWIRRNPELARSTLQTMADQRAKLGLGAPATLSPELPVVPVVAFGAPTADQAHVHQQAVSRAKLVADALRRGSFGAPLIEWLRVEADGTAKPL